MAKVEFTYGSSIYPTSSKHYYKSVDFALTIVGAVKIDPSTKKVYVLYFNDFVNFKLGIFNPEAISGTNMLVKTHFTTKTALKIDGYPNDLYAKFDRNSADRFIFYSFATTFFGEYDGGQKANNYLFVYASTPSIDTLNLPSMT